MAVLSDRQRFGIAEIAELIIRREGELSQSEGELSHLINYLKLRLPTYRDDAKFTCDFSNSPIDALIKWLSRPTSGWVQVLEGPKKEAAEIIRILSLIEFHTRAHEYAPREVAELTLLARRLMWYSASNIQTSHAVLVLRLNQFGKWQLAHPSVFAPSRALSPYRNCSRARAMSFVVNALAFLTREKVFGGLGVDKDAVELAKDRGLRFGASYRGRWAGIKADRCAQNRAKRVWPKVFDIHAAYTSYMAPDPRAVIGIDLLRESMLGPVIGGFPDRMRHRKLRFLAGFLPTFFSTPALDLGVFRKVEPVKISAICECRGR